MMYAYGLTEIHPETARHCNFQKVGGRATGTYAFNTGYYGLTIMPAEFQKIMDKLFHKIRRYSICNKGHSSTTYGKKEEVI